MRKELSGIVERNAERKREQESGAGAADSEGGVQKPKTSNRVVENVLDHIVDMREYDVPYVMRCAIDNELFVGLWYSVNVHEGDVTIQQRPDLTSAWGRAEPRVLAFDIECTKEPLKFPDAAHDKIYMISYMIDGEGFLITNREYVSEDIEDFEYTPKKEYEGPFQCFNEESEYALLRRFLDHIQEVKPTVFVTYNGDFFDFPFIDARMKTYNLSMEQEIGVQKQQGEEYAGRFVCHLDAFHWVNRDSYLPQGSRGLKAVTKYKLGYDPKEIDPEDMLPFARERPQEMAAYSVSDAVATYYLYMQYVHPFIFSLCNIIPMTPDDVLRKGSGTLCETLLQVQAFRGNIVCPNKHKDDPLKVYKGHLIDTETYVGGHVEALNSGVFRSDFSYKFDVDPGAIDELIENLDRDLTFAIEVEGGKKMETVLDYEEQKGKIVQQLLELKAAPKREEKPYIYHLDVAAMYPNIILTNRLQPPAMVTKQDCSSCDFYHPEMKCRREMDWTWRGELFPTSNSEVRQITGQLKHDSDNFSASASEVRKRVKEYSNKVYKRVHDTKTELRTAYICQRENSFYIDTVRSFRDRRYEYKGLTKKWGVNLKDAEKAGDAARIKECKNFVVLYDSLQLAHKCILNSFYGYVMRRGARWYSMEMAGVVTHKGGDIIRVARKLVERIGIPLELDTDGIWCCLPQSFPDGIEFKVDGEKKPFVVSYPCSMLNAQTHHDCINPQYHTLVDEAKQEYAVHSECSILFELDGPYKAMILPAAKEEGKRLKKRYAVFNFDGSLAELKGFELKRRGELQLVKSFQSEVFKRFLDGSTLDECYQSVAAVANQWIDVLDTRGVALEDEELIELISEEASMSKTMEQYGDRKSMAITTANRIAEFLGADMIKNKGLNCKYIVSRTPEGTPVTERAVPVEIFKAEEAVQMLYLKKWCHTSTLVDSSVDIRSILDWNYYRERLGSTIQKIVTIPAAMQNVVNPVERVPHPDWLLKIVRERLDPMKQKNITSFFGTSDRATASAAAAAHAAVPMDIEGVGSSRSSGGATVVKHLGAGKKGKRQEAKDEMQVVPLPPIEESVVVKLGRPVEAYGTTMYTDFDKWHQHMAAKWRNMAIERKKRKLEEAGEIEGTLLRKRQRPGAAGVTVADAFVSIQRLLLYRHFYVVKISSTSTPGLFNLWAVVDDGSMHVIKLEVPRIFYVNKRPSEAESAGSMRKGLNKKLPFGKQCYNLVEEMMSEEDYQNYDKVIADAVADPTVEGLYETEVPLEFRALMDVGCVASVNRRPGGYRDQVLKHGKKPDRISMLDIKFETTTACPYLPTKRVRMRKAFLYHSLSDNDKGARGLIGLMAPMDSNKCTVWVYNKNGSAQRPPMSRILADACSEDALQFAEGSVEREYIDKMAQAGIDFTVEVVQSRREALREVSERLNKFKDEAPTAPTVVLKQSTESAHDISIYLDEFAVMDVPAQPHDNNYDALGWEVKAGTCLARNLIQVERFFEYILGYARYAHMPLCNISANDGDMATRVSDVLLGRLLKNNNYVLWGSPGRRPDVGTADQLLAFECDELHNPDINCPGAYKSYCVSMDIQALPVTAIIHAKDIDDITPVSAAAGPDAFQEKVALQVAAGTIPLAAALVDEMTFCLDPFKIMAYMAENWVRDAQKRRCPYADSLQMNLFHWVKNPRSLFFSQHMVRFVHKLMRKTHNVLLHKLRALGAEVVHASFHELVLNTKKAQWEQAQSLIEFVTSELKLTPWGPLLSLEPSRYWARLVWMDHFNFAGLEDGSDEHNEGALLGNQLTDPELRRQGLVLQSEWEMGEHLPKKHRQVLHELVADLMCLPFKFRLSELDACAQERDQDGATSTPGLTQKRRAVGEVDKLEVLYSKELFESPEAGAARVSPESSPHFSRRLYDFISKESSSLGAFPSRPGTHRDMRAPQLELLKQACEIFALDDQVKAEVGNMKRALLRVLKVREFSDQAKFQNPSRCVVLPDVFCSSNVCASARDVDLCREGDIVASVTRLPNGGLATSMRCHHCEMEYDMDMIEQRLVQAVQQVCPALLPSPSLPLSLPPSLSLALPAGLRVPLSLR